MGIATSYPIPNPNSNDNLNNNNNGHKTTSNLQKRRLVPITNANEDEELYDDEMSEDIKNIKSNLENLESKLDLKIKELDLKIKELDS